MKRYLKMLSVVFLMLMFLAMPVHALGIGQTGIVNYDYLNVRKAATTDSSLITQLDYHDIVWITGSKDGFWRVRCFAHNKEYKNVYVAKQYISDYDLTEYAYTKTKVKLYSAPNTTSKLVAYVAKNSKIKQLRKYKGFTRVMIQSNDKNWYGWINSIYISESKNTEPVAWLDIAYVSSTTLNLRYLPGTNFTLVKKLYKGDRLDVLERRSGWCKVRAYRNNNTYEGWVLEKYTRK